ncbi:hypothetical protein DFH06DRAFT_1190653 [Mycena polygramma]|nr:hypothetical protein DFH06DRAFT_1190653 [Mycena polygramma]
MRTRTVFSVLAVFSSTALASVVHLEYRDDTPTTSTGQPLTVTLSVSPSPTETGTAVSAAYAAYSQACGPALARVMQDGLAVYNSLADVPTTNISDPGFVQWLNQQDTPYQQALSTCNKLDAALDLVATPNPSSTTPTQSQSSGSGGSQASSSAGGVQSRSTPGPTTPTSSAPSPSSTKGAAHHHGPEMVLPVVMALWAVHRMVLG